ncbi:hypothetical protein BC828DRAFT_410037, partial [Blastocladiella britannica]
MSPEPSAFPPHPYSDPARQPLAFGRRAIPKLVAECTTTSTNAATAPSPSDAKRRSLHSLTALLADPVAVAEALATPLISVANTELKCADATCRALAAEILDLITVHEAGTMQAIEHDSLAVLLSLINDTDATVRLHAYNVIANMTAWPHYAARFPLTHPSLITTLLTALTQEHKKSLAHLTPLLTALSQLLASTPGDATIALAAVHAKLIPTVTSLLVSGIGGTNARALAVSCIASVAVHAARTPDPVVPAVLGAAPALLSAAEHDPAASVRAAAARAIAGVAADVPAKRAVVKLGVAGVLVRVLAAEAHGAQRETAAAADVAAAVLSAVAVVGEEPEARAEFSEALGI